jgi:hypothetical protein
MTENLQNVQKNFLFSPPPKSPKPLPRNLKSSPDSTPFEDDSNNVSLSFQLSKSSTSEGNNKLKSSHSFLNSFKTISDRSLSQSILNELETDTKKYSELQRDFLKENQIHFTSFASPNKIFCNFCNKEVYSIVKAKEKPKAWALGRLLKIVCCENKEEGEKEMLHYCCKCNKVLARVLSRL